MAWVEKNRKINNRGGKGVDYLVIWDLLRFYYYISSNNVLILVRKRPFGFKRNYDFWYHFCPSDMSFRHTHQGFFMTS